MNDRSNILVVDDELGPREALRMILKPSYDVFTAEDGHKALELLQKIDFDLVTLDLRMPKIHGSDLLKAIKKYNQSVEVVIITGYGTLKSAIESLRWGVFDYIIKPFDVTEIISVVAKSIDRSKLNQQKIALVQSFMDFKKTLVEGNPPGEEWQWRTLRELFNEFSQDVKNDGDRYYVEFAKTLAHSIERSRSNLHGQADRISFYSLLMGQRLEFSEEEISALRVATYLHDIGTLWVSGRILKKEGDLDEEEARIFRRHPELGIDLIRPLDDSQIVLDVIRHHHERYDGCGYPDGLKGKEIPLTARIVAIASGYDRLISIKDQTGPMSPKEAKDFLFRGGDGEFDPDLTEIFVKLADQEHPYLAENMPIL
ncbi:HD domain-containing phosphohydrolase [Thermodesulfobacteriota bacterium]